MRIAFLSAFYPYRGGIAQFNASLYRELEKSQDVKAYTFTRQYPDFLFPGETQFVTDKDSVDKIPSVRLLDTINPLSYLKTTKEIAKYKPDLLIMKFWMPFFAPSLGFVAAGLRKRGTKIVTVLDNVIPHEKRPGDIQLIRYFLNRNDAFIAMSDTVKRDLLSLKPNAKVELKPHPIYDHFGAIISKESARQKLQLDLTKRTILFFGFIRDYKGLDLLIDAAKNLTDDFQIIVAGEVYGNFEKYQKRIESNGVSEKFKLFIRYISDDEVTVFFSAADVCVLPYKSATQSGIVQIAYNFDLPVIATNVGGLSEMIYHNETGLLLDKNDASTLAENITNYFTHNLYPKFSSEIRRRKSFFSWEGFAEAILKLV